MQTSKRKVLRVTVTMTVQALPGVPVNETEHRGTIVRMCDTIVASLCEVQHTHCGASIKKVWHDTITPIIALFVINSI